MTKLTSSVLRSVARELADPLLYRLDPLLYRLDPHYVFHRARRDWNKRAREMPMETTATFDATDGDTYWASGDRDLRLLLDLAAHTGPMGSEFAVEIGCGLGRITRPLAERFERVMGVDISEEMLKQASAHTTSPKIMYRLVAADQRLPIGDDVADLVIAWTVFRHTAKAVFNGYLREAHRALKEGACLVFDAQIRETGNRRDPSPYHSLTEREYSRAELRTHCERQGLRWAAERTTAPVTPGTSTLVLAWVRRTQ